MPTEWINDREMDKDGGGGGVYIYIYRKKFAAIWMDPETIILSELSQTEAEISYKILIM